MGISRLLFPFLRWTKISICVHATAVIKHLVKSTAKKPIRTNVSSALVGKATVKRELMGCLEGLLLLCVSECTYGAVEDHEAVVEVVMLHGGVAVELGQWVVAPGHTHTHKK